MIDWNPDNMDEDLVQQRYEAAEEVCNTLLLMIELGGLEIDMEWREFLAKPLGKWSDMHFAALEREDAMRALSKIGENKKHTWKS